MNEALSLRQLNDEAWAKARLEPATALELAEAAENRAREAGDVCELGKALRSRGACLLELGRLAEAHRLLCDAEALLEGRSSCSEPRAHTYRLLARTCFLQQEFEQALLHSHDSLRACQEIDDVSLKAAALNDAGMIYAHLGSYKQGLDYLLGSLRLLEEKNVPLSGNPLNNIGNVYLLMADPENALEYFRRAQAAYEFDGSPREKLTALSNVGRALEAMGELDRAVEIFTDCLAEVRASDNRAYLAPTLTKYGVTLGKLGRTEEAFASLHEAMMLSDESEAPFLDETMFALAQLHLHVGEPEKAEPLYRRAVDVARERNNRQSLANAYLGLANALEALERWQESLESFQCYHELDAKLSRELFSTQTQALLLHAELKQSRRERKLLQDTNEELSNAYEGLRALHQELEAKSAELQRLSLEDPLTKLFNRRELEHRLADELARVGRHGGTFSVLICDIDDFKAINDNHSHILGDDILVTVGQILRSNSREADVVARVGGEEFVLLLPETNKLQALVVAEKIRRAIASYPWRNLVPGLEVTMSAGVTEAAPKEAVAALLMRADRQLYRAKRLGKNQVCCADEVSSAHPQPST